MGTQTIKKIPIEEFKKRQANAKRKVQEKGLDAILIHSNEADLANVRYFSDYWPIFESAGALIPAESDPILLIGPESETYARDKSAIPDIRRVLYYREAAEPDYPDMKLDSFKDIFASLNGGRGVKRLGIVGGTAMPVSVYEHVKAALPDAEIVKADDILHEMRAIKSENEIALLREAFRVSEVAMDEVLKRIKPGMTELQVVGIAQEAMYMNGAEYEGHPTYSLSGINTTHAIGRPSHKVIKKGELLQVDIGSRVGGYSSSIAVPFTIGKMSPEIKDLIGFCLEAHEKTITWLKAGIKAGKVAEDFYDYAVKRGYADKFVYGPCHGIGMIEVERPWMETSSDYLLQENMTFQVDTFFAAPEFGCRWERGIRITTDGVEEFSSKFRKIIELE